MIRWGPAVMSNCPSVVRLLYSYCDREVGPIERDKVDAHLAGCPACRALYAIEGQFLDLLKIHLATPRIARYSVRES